MLPFFRKKPKEDVAEEEKEIKKPVKRKKKAEPPKPWGKIERAIVFIFLVSAPILSILFLVHSKDSKSAKPIPVTTKILGDVIPKNPPNVDELRESLANKTKDLTGTYGIWVESLDGSYKLGINESEDFDGASLFKLPLMIAYYKDIENGTLDPDTNYTLKHSDAQSGAGVLASLPPGTVVTYRDMIEAMGKNSDNTAFSIMLNTMGIDKEVDMIDKLGMDSTDFDTSATTPEDIGKLFYKLSNENFIPNKSKQEMFSYLANTDYENLIPGGIPDSIRVIHKYGADSGELNDAGIIYADKPFILVILAKDIDGVEATAEIPKITKLVYDWAVK